MLTIFPVNEKELENYGDIEENVVILSAKENNKELAYISFNLFDNKAQIIDIKIYTKDDTKELTDALIKSVISYLLNRNVFICESTNSNLFFILEDFGFRKLDDKMVIDITKIIKRCKHC